LKKIFSNRSDPAQKKTGPRSAQNKLGPDFYRVGLSPAAWAGLGFQPKTSMDWYCRTCMQEDFYAQCRFCMQEDEQ